MDSKTLDRRISQTIQLLPELNESRARICDKVLSFSFMASIINLIHKDLISSDHKERVLSLRYLNLVIGLLILYGFIALKPMSIYKSFTKKKKRKESTKKRVRVLNYTPLPSPIQSSKENRDS